MEKGRETKTETETGTEMLIWLTLEGLLKQYELRNRELVWGKCKKKKKIVQHEGSVSSELEICKPPTCGKGKNKIELPGQMRPKKQNEFNQQ